MSAPQPPPTPKRPWIWEQFGRRIVDDYAWIRQKTWFQDLRTPELLDPVIRSHLEAENAYTDAVLAPVADLQAELAAEMMRRASGDDGAPADPDGDWAYFARTAPGAEYPQMLRRPRGGGDEQLLLDLAAEAARAPYYRLSELSLATPSPDHRLYAWAADEAGDQHFRLYVKDLETGALAASVVESCYGSFCFSPDSKWLFWVDRDAMSRPTKVFRRPAMGGDDVLVYEEADPGFYLAVERLRSNAFVQVRVYSGTSSEAWLIPAADPTAAPRLVEPRAEGMIYELEHWNDRFVVRTNADGAVDYKLMLADDADVSRAGWKDWLPHAPGRFVSAVRAYRRHFARIEWVDANPRLIVTGLDLVEAAPIAMDDEAYTIGLEGAAYDTAVLRYAYQSPATPPRWIDCDMDTGERKMVATRQVADFDPQAYQVRRLFARAPDGEQIPITVLMRRDTPLDGRAPMLLYGYGSYGYSVPPDFHVPNLSLADRGWVVAIAHIRGGGEKGPGWYEQVRGMGKKTSITDFIACADHLVAQAYSRAGRIVSHGLSAAGIIIGGGVNLRPELWAGAIAQVPFVDVLASAHDFSNPLIPGAYAVWGDPANRDVFEYMAGYSPYDNITAQAYPAVLGVGGLLDNRVGYWEPAKWVARIREKTTGGRPALLRINMTAGHQGHAGLAWRMGQAAFFYAFAIWTVRTAGAPP